MTRDETMIQVMESRARRREDRRDFFKLAATAAVAAPIVLTMGGKPLSAQTTVTDPDVLNFALNLEYLEANFYSYAAFGTPISAALIGGTGTPGAATGGRAVTFTDPIVAQHAREIAYDEIAHVTFLRNQLGGAAVAQPTIDVGTSPTGAFSSAARAAGLIAAGASFDPYSSDENFLLAAFIFEDVGVTAYKGAAPLISNKTYLDAAAGILAVEAYHASLIRTTLDQKGIATPSLFGATEAISAARDSLDGPTDLDQGITPGSNGSNIAPTDGFGIAFSRSAAQVLNIVYLRSTAGTSGGFFPNGVNGTIRTSQAN